MRQDIESILFSEEAISSKVSELGEHIADAYRDRDVVLVNILRGGVIFLSDLARAISIPLTIDFMAISSYGPELRGSGIVKVLKDLEESIYGRDVLIVEDIIDTGLTLSYLLKNLEARSPSSVSVCTLLDRPARRIADNLPVRYRGFEIPDVFVVGYGLDYKQKYRNLPYIGVLKEQVYESGLS